MLDGTQAFAENVDWYGKKNFASALHEHCVQPEIGHDRHDSEPTHEINVALDHAATVGDQVAGADLGRSGRIR